MTFNFADIRKMFQQVVPFSYIFVTYYPMIMAGELKNIQNVRQNAVEKEFKDETGFLR